MIKKSLYPLFYSNALWVKAGRIMRLTIFIIFATLLQVSAKSNAQKINLKVQNATLSEVFREIKHQTHYSFFWKSNLLKGTNRTSLNINNVSIEEALQQCLKGQPLTFTIDGKIIYIKAKVPASSPAASQPPQTALAQSPIKITGRVVDSSGNPLAGASIQIVGTQTTTLTNEKGEFTINADQTDKLEVKFVGFEPQIIQIDGHTVITIILKPQNQSLNDIVVVGFGTQKKTDIVSAVSTITAKELNYPVRNLSNMLQGKVSGALAIQRSGEPGYDNSTFWIRGVSSFAGGTNPLIIVDGVPRTTFNDIDPNEIETLSILKDATATAVYGAEGANGVVVITTRRGLAEKTKISYRGEYSTLTPLRMPTFLGSADYLDLYNEALSNEGRAAIYSDSLINLYRTHADPDLYPDDNWMALLLNNHTENTTHNITFTGGNEKARYFVSGSYYNESGIFVQNPLAQYNNNIGLKRYNLRSNIDLDITKSTLLSINLAGQYLETNYPGQGTADILQSISRTPPFLYPAVFSNGQLAGPYNPSGNRQNPYNRLMNSGYTNEYRTVLQSIVSVKQKLDFITQGLSVKGTVSFEADGNFYTSRSKSISTYYATGRDGDGNLILNQATNGTGNLSDPSNSNDATKNIYLEGSLNYNRTFDQLHKITGLLLTYDKESQSQGNIGLPFRTRGYVGRATYSYDNRYSLEGNFGMTGSENFAKGHRYGIFPSFGVAWNLSNEHYYPERLKNAVSTVKIRFTMGRTGNDNTGGARFLYRGTFGGGGGFNMGYGQTGALNGYTGEIEGQFEAPELSWEIQDEKNYGLDLGFIKDKISLTVDYFTSVRSNILLQRRTVAAVAGFRQSPWQNFGKVSNHGVDLSLNMHQKIGTNSLLTVQGNFTYAHNKILEYDEVPPLYPWMAVTGQSVGYPSIYIAEGLYTDADFDITAGSDGEKVYTLKSGLPVSSLSSPVMPGDIKYKDLNGDGIINQFDQTRQYKGAHPENPEINYGFGTTFQWKGFYVSAYFTGVANTSTILGGANGQLFFPFQWGIEESAVRSMDEDRWRQDDPRQNVLFPRVRTAPFANNSAASTWWLRDASFIRLKNAEFGYNFSKDLIKKWTGLKTDGARLYIMGYNLLTWDHIGYWDPEQGNGSEGLAYPQSRTFSVGLQLHL